MDDFIVYAKTNDAGCITEVNSSAFVPDNWGVEIDSGTDYRHHHAQSNYFPGGLYTEDGIPRYKLQDGQAVDRTEEEIAADLAAIVQPVTQMEQMRASIDFLAAIGGIAL